ncbi:MAG: DUF4157 domain-containing protein [Acidimicrobiales bacterium]
MRLARARQLEGPELGAYKHISQVLTSRVQLVRVPWLPNGADGLTIGKRVLVKREVDPSKTKKLIAHELVHVRQWAEYGVVGFLARYVFHYLRNLIKYRKHYTAYLEIPFEIEARAEAEQWSEARA